ncbi:MAG: hypothetical protein ACK5MR_03320 [Cumulibacter sp.]
MAILIIVLIIVAATAAGFWIEHQRKKRIHAFAAARSLTYVARDNRWARVDTGRPYGEGHSHKIKHVMTGAHRGRPITIYEHQWTTGSGKESQTHVMHKTLVGLPKSFPRLELSQEGMFGRLARRMGMKDIELESDDFNQKYRVAGERRFAYDVLHPRMMQWMLSAGAPGFTINGPYIVLADSGKLDLSAVDAEIQYLDSIIEQLPRYVVG